ncbi:hypothetical protein FACS1894127_3090 [Clostridia bacterium]|nr:hypothetical protein FACS1894127_3090 [Clostridia bacterium]
MEHFIPGDSGEAEANPGLRRPDYENTGNGSELRRQGEAYTGNGSEPEYRELRSERRSKNIKPGKNETTTKTQKGKGRGGIVAFLISLVFILLSVIFCFMWFVLLPSESVDPLTPETEIQIVEPTVEELESRGWIPSDKIKKYAEEFNLNTEFLSRIFTDKIIYKDGGRIYYSNINPDYKRHTYDWRTLVWDNKRPSYVHSSGSVALLGIDVSRYQTDIDWKKVAADGISFAMIRLGYRGYSTGAIVMDEYFEANIKQAQEAGVKTGIYFFSQAINEDEAREEADTIITAIKPYNVTFPIVFDMEEISGNAARVDNLDKNQVSGIAAAFCERVKASGYTPMIYANPKWFVAKMNLDQLEDYEKWLAQYYTTPSYPYAFSIWQYSDSGKVDGIKGNVDMNLSFVDYQ